MVPTENGIVPSLLAMGKKKRATEFEIRVRNFLERLGFNDIGGGTDAFKINDVQVDVCGGHENTLLVIECTMLQILGKKSIRDKIVDVRGKQKGWESGFKRHPAYRKYTNFVYVVAAKNIVVSK